MYLVNYVHTDYYYKSITTPAFNKIKWVSDND